MAYIVPPTFTAGEILTAAQMTILGNDILSGGPIYATEAARDAAIPSPFEGQRAYITGSTIASATGTNAAIPTGIQCIHNGSITPTAAANWVCVTPVGANTPASGTLSGTVAFTPTLGGSPGTNPTVTLCTGTTALVSISLVCVASGTATVQADISVSGATTVAAGSYLISNQFSASDVNYHKQLATTVIVTGLTAGTNTFTLNYTQNGAGTATFLNRRLVAQGIA